MECDLAVFITLNWYEIELSDIQKSFHTFTVQEIFSYDNNNFQFSTWLGTGGFNVRGFPL